MAKCELIKYRGFYIDRDIDFVSVYPITEWDTVYPLTEEKLRCRDAVTEAWKQFYRNNGCRNGADLILEAKKLIDEIKIQTRKAGRK